MSPPRRDGEWVCVCVGGEVLSGRKASCMCVLLAVGVTVECGNDKGALTVSYMKTCDTRERSATCHVCVCVCACVYVLR